MFAVPGADVCSPSHLPCDCSSPWSLSPERWSDSQRNGGRHNVSSFGRIHRNSGMESGGKSKLALNCAGEGKGVGRTPLALLVILPIMFLMDSLEGLGG